MSRYVVIIAGFALFVGGLTEAWLLFAYATGLLIGAWLQQCKPRDEGKGS